MKILNYLKVPAIILIPAALISVLSIFLNPCITGFSFFIDICLLHLRNIIPHFWLTASLLFIIFCVFRIKNKIIKKENELSSAVIYAFFSLFLVWFLLFGWSSLSYEFEKIKIGITNLFSEKYNNVIFISDFKESYRYNQWGKIDYIDISMKAASKIPTNARAHLSIITPPGVNFNYNKENDVHFDKTPTELVFSIKALNYPKRFDGNSFKIMVNFVYFSQNFEKKTKIDNITFQYSETEKMKCQRDQDSPSDVYCSFRIFKTREYKYSDFFQEPTNQGIGTSSVFFSPSL